MNTPTGLHQHEFFDPWQGNIITSWQSALEEIEAVLKLTGSTRTLGWRGQVDAGWNLHSSLYRRIINSRPISSKAPEERDLLRAEQVVFDIARQGWRFDQMPYLEMLANLQHFRAPTRLLDVSVSPLVALWFAVEKQHNDELDDADGRLFAFDTTRRRIQLDARWSSYEIPWQKFKPSSPWRRELPLLWSPPSYNDRIPAQQSGFLLAGVPSVYGGDNANYRKAPGTQNEFWKIDRVRRATSVPTRLRDRHGRALDSRSEPTLTLRIAGSAKNEIRHRLEKAYGYNPSTMYPDLFGMAEEIRREIDSADALTLHKPSTSTR